MGLALFDKQAFDHLLKIAVQAEASTVFIVSHCKPIYKAHGRHHPLWDRPIKHYELNALLSEIIGGEAVAMLLSGKALNPSGYQIAADRHTRYRFRIHVETCWTAQGRGFDLTIRHIHSIPPSVEELDVEPAIVAATKLQHGLILVTGAAGMGKSTLLAALIRFMYEHPERDRKIVTYEAPIEYVHETYHERTLVLQKEIPSYLPSFNAAIVEAMRAEPSVILLGELRDRETIAAAIQAANTGHLVLATVHAASVAETVYRMVSLFDDRAFYQTTLLYCLKCVVAQYLAPSTDNKRVAVREFLKIDDAIRDTLLATAPELLSQTTHDFVQQKGQSMAMDAARKKHSERIDQKEYDYILQAYGG